jgi:hypothetical protein
VLVYTPEVGIAWRLVGAVGDVDDAGSIGLDCAGMPGVVAVMN